MRAAAFETLSPNHPITELPATLEQTASKTSPLLMLVLALPAAIAALTPFALIAVHAAQDTSVLADRQETCALLAFALLVWAGLFGWPIVERALSIGRTRKISIAGQAVHVTEAGPFGCTTWSQPLDAYAGLAHHVRSSLSGTRHELILIHPETRRSLLLRTSDRIGQVEIDHLAQLLGCREIAPQAFYVSSDWPVTTAPVQSNPGLATMN